jgi:hypothetical protein
LAKPGINLDLEISPLIWDLIKLNKFGDQLLRDCMSAEEEVASKIYFI